MNREDITRMAEESGFSEAVTRMVLHTYDLGVEAGAAAEREACARVLEAISNAPDIKAYADAIRARGHG